MKRKTIFIITFACCMICGLMYFYYVGKNGYTTRTQVVYAVTDEALQFYIVDNLFLFWFPFSVLFSYGVEYFYYNAIKIEQIQQKSPRINFLGVFCIYICVMIFKILQLWTLGEHMINDMGELEACPPLSLMNAISNVISISSIGRHLFWIIDSVALSYLITRMTYKTC